jgi:F-type H+-transporting ATPase subunit a
MKHYFTPSPLLMPLNVISEFSGSLALAIRLYGNIMSGAIIGMVLLLVIPFIFPVFIQLLGFVSGIIQAYIFSMLALVFIVSAEPED